MKRILRLENISKHYRILNNREGLWGTIKDLFSRDYRIVKAVDDISFEIQSGEMVGVIGPNGAGKSTTIKMLTGVLKPTCGVIDVAGFIPYKDRVKYVKSIGVVFGQRTQLWWDLPVIESYKLCKEIYGIPDKLYNDNLGLFNEIVNINELIHIPARRLSLGQRMLCDIVAAVLHDPQILFLDEPSIGLDILIKNKIRTIIKDINQAKKTTVLVTSHDVGDIEVLCDRIIMIDRGKVIFDDAVSAFNSTFGTYRTLKIELPDKESMFSVIARVKNRFGDSDAIKYKTTPNNWLVITIHNDRKSLLDIFGFIFTSFSVKDIKIEEAELEHLIRKIYEDFKK